MNLDFLVVPVGLLVSLTFVTGCLFSHKHAKTLDPPRVLLNCKGQLKALATILALPSENVIIRALV